METDMQELTPDAAWIRDADQLLRDIHALRERFAPDIQQRIGQVFSRCPPWEEVNREWVAMRRENARLTATVSAAFSEGFDAALRDSGSLDDWVSVREQCWERSAAHADLIGNSE